MLKLFERFKKKEIYVVKPFVSPPPQLPKKPFLQVGSLYICYTNNKDNITVGKYLGEKEFDHNRFTLSIFEDVVTKDEYLHMVGILYYTEKRLRAMSSLHYTDLIELFFHKDGPYEMAEQINEEYVDPITNMHSIMTAIQSELSK